MNCTHCGVEVAGVGGECPRCGMALVPSQPAAPPRKPGQITAIAILTLISGIVNISGGCLMCFYGIFVGALTFGLGCLAIPFAVFGLVLGAIEIVYATSILADPIRASSPNRIVAVMEIVCILGCNWLAAATGILALVFYNDPVVRDYFAQVHDWNARR